MKHNRLIVNSIRLVALGISLAWFTTGATAAPAVYVVNGYNQFGVVDLSSGAFHAIGAPTPEPQSNLVGGPNGSLYTIGAVSGDLESINPSTGATTVVGWTGLPFFPTGASTAFDLAGVNGKLYLTDFSNNLYSVNPTTGMATMIGATGMPPDPSIPFTINADGTWNLCDESLYGVGGKLYATFDSFTIDPNTLAIKVKIAPYLYRIDPSTGLATVVGPTSLNLGSPVDVGGQFYAFRLEFTGWTQYGPLGRSELDTLDLTSGGTAFAGNIDPASGPIFGAAPVPEPTTLSMLGIGMLGAWARWRRK
jgi:PEP-CTERM motif